MKAAIKAKRLRPGARRRKKSLTLMLAMAAATVRAIPPEQEEPRWLSAHLTGGYLKLDSEAEQETAGSSQGGVNGNSQRLYLAPSIGLGAAGSIYHPDLFAFTLQAQPGYVWQDTILQGSSSTLQSVLQTYDFSGTVLQLKPYATTFLANASHDVHDYDFFNSVVSDQQTWGVNTGYRTGPVPVTLTFQDSHQDITGLAENSTFDQTTLNLHAHNDRSRGDATDLTYMYGDFTQTTGDGGGSFSDTSRFNQANLTDMEHFGKATLNSSALYTEQESPSVSSEAVTATLDLGVQHTDYLHSSYGYAFSHYDDSLSDVDQHSLHAGVQHQLYESLSSALDLHGSTVQNSSDGARFDSQSVGILGTVNYTKRLGAWGRLTIGNSTGYDFTQQSSSGGVLSVPQESHSVTTATAQFRLSQPRVMDISSVTSDAAHGYQALQEGLDYTVDQSVDPWLITVNFASVRVQNLEVNGSVTLLISYDVTANPSGSYSTLSDQFNVRLDLFRGLVGFYTRLDVIDNTTAVPGFVLENLTELQAGADFTWDGLQLNAKYLDRHSTLYDYTAKTLSENYSFKLDSYTRAGVELRQQWSDYLSQGGSATYYDFLAHLTWQEPHLHLNWSVEGGLLTQHGLGLDQTLAVARTRLDWHYGKLSTRLGYDYQNQDFNGETRARHFIYLRFRRDF